MKCIAIFRNKHGAFNMTTFTEKLGKHWQEKQEKSIINLKSLSNEESEKADKAEEVVSDTVRWTHFLFIFHLYTRGNILKPQPNMIPL